MLRGRQACDHTRFWLSIVHSSVAEHWQLKPGDLWFKVTAGFLIFVSYNIIFTKKSHNLQEALVVLSALVSQPDPCRPVDPSNQGYHLCHQYPTCDKNKCNVNVVGKRCNSSSTHHKEDKPVILVPRCCHHDPKDPVTKIIKQ